MLVSLMAAFGPGSVWVREQTDQGFPTPGPWTGRVQPVRNGAAGQEVGERAEICLHSQLHPIAGPLPCQISGRVRILTEARTCACEGSRLYVPYESRPETILTPPLVYGNLVFPKSTKTDPWCQKRLGIAALTRSHQLLL